MMAIPLFLGRDRAKPRDNLSSALGKTPGKTAIHGDHAFFRSRSRQSRQRPANGLGKISAEDANHGHYALFDHPCAKNSDNPPLGKLQRKPPIMAATLFLDRDHAKASTTHTGWENSWGKRQSWPFGLFPIAIVPKPAATRELREKLQGKTPIMAIPEESGDRAKATLRLGEGGEENPDNAT